MINPVSSGIRCQRKVAYGKFVNFVIEMEEDAEAGMGKDGVRSYGLDVIV